jgi:hypothetical protein
MENHMMTKIKNSRWILILFLAGMLPGLACQASALSPGAKATPSNPGSVQILQPDTPGPTGTPASGISIPILGIGGKEATPTQSGNIQILGNDTVDKPAVQPVNGDFQPVRVVEELMDFLAGGTGAGKLVVIENPNADLAIQDTRCMLSSYDSNGSVLDTAQCEVGLLFPGERRTIYVGLVSQSTTPPAKLGFTITQQGQAVQTSLTSASLVTERAKYWSTEGKIGRAHV